MKKIANILLGWWFWITNKHNKLARERLNVCLPCPERKGFLCGSCGCVLQAKARLEEEECPFGLWQPGYNPWK